MTYLRYHGWKLADTKHVHNCDRRMSLGKFNTCNMKMRVRVGLVVLKLRLMEDCCVRSWIWHLMLVSLNVWYHDISYGDVGCSMVMTSTWSPWVHVRYIIRVLQFMLVLMHQGICCSSKCEKMAWCYVQLMAQLLNDGGLNALLIWLTAQKTRFFVCGDAMEDRLSSTNTTRRRYSNVTGQDRFSKVIDSLEQCPWEGESRPTVQQIFVLLWSPTFITVFIKAYQFSVYVVWCKIGCHSKQAYNWGLCFSGMLHGVVW